MSLENSNVHTPHSLEDDSGAEEKKLLKREQDSSDDFEQVDPESLTNSESTGPSKVDTQLQEKQHEESLSTQQPSNQVNNQVQPSSAPPPPLLQPRVDDYFPQDLNKSFDSNSFDSKDRSVPATPPPSADIEKFDSMADPFQPRAALQPSLLSSDFLASEKQALSSEKSFEPARTAVPAVNSVHEDSAKKNLEDSAVSSKEENARTEEEKELQQKSCNLNPDKSASVKSEVSDFKEPPSSENLVSIEKESTGGPEIAAPLTSVASKSLEGNADAALFKDNKKAMEDDSSDVVKKRDGEVIVPAAFSAQDIRENAKKVDDFTVKEKQQQEQRQEKQQQQQHNEVETGNSEFESEQEASPARIPTALSRDSAKEDDVRHLQSRERKGVEDIDIAPKKIFPDLELGAWFNPERLNPRVAALIYWRDPKKSGVVFGTILGLLLSLAYFSLISVLAYLSLLVLTGTVAYRIYKSVLQAVQKTSDGHPFKYILDLDLTLPAEKVHEVADVAVAHANAAVSELRRLFLVEDIVDSLKFGVLLWCLTYVGSWFNGMTLIIIGVVAMFTLPKVYETNKAQIDENWALVEGKINDLTAKIKAAIPLVKKPEPTKEE